MAVIAYASLIAAKPKAEFIDRVIGAANEVSRAFGDQDLQIKGKTA